MRNFEKLSICRNANEATSTISDESTAFCRTDHFDKLSHFWKAVGSAALDCIISVNGPVRAGSCLTYPFAGVQHGLVKTALHAGVPRTRC